MTQIKDLPSKNLKGDLIFGLTVMTNYELRNEIEWEDAIRKIFPVSVPLSSKWIIF